MLIAAIWHLPVGIVGFVYERSFPIGASAAERADSAHVFGIFETNGWHNLGALVIGLLALYFAVNAERAREVALAIGIFHVGLVVALIVWEPSTFWIASNDADQVIHATSAIGGVATGLATPSSSSVRGHEHHQKRELEPNRPGH